jgi:L,D-transpeptidase ErfK/SrfK
MRAAAEWTTNVRQIPPVPLAVVLAAVLLRPAAPLLLARQSRTIAAGAISTHVVGAGETLNTVGARFGADPRTIAEDNGLSPAARLRVGQILRVDGRHLVPGMAESAALVVNVPQRMLFIRLPVGLTGLPVAVGRRDWPTPIARFEIATRETDPTWDVPASIQKEMALQGRAVLTTVPPGPDNPLGDRYIGLKDAGLGLHGTNQPASIYRFATHGCIRLHPEDVRTLFELVKVGDLVEIVYMPVMAAVDDGGRVWLEVNPDVYGRTGDLSRAAWEHLSAAGATSRTDPRAVARCVRERRGRVCDVTQTVP